MDSVLALTRKCAECGKEFACHPDVHAWAMTVKSVRSYYCSYHCMRTVEKRMQAAGEGRKKITHQQWEQKFEKAQARQKELLAIRNSPEWEQMDRKKRKMIASRIINTRKRIEELEDEEP